MKTEKQSKEEGLRHSVTKLTEILSGPLSASDQWPQDRRWWLQLGYNLGRYSELSEEGRKVWDDWKVAIESKDHVLIEKLLTAMKQDNDDC